MNTIIKITNHIERESEKVLDLFNKAFNAYRSIKSSVGKGLFIFIVGVCSIYVYFALKSLNTFISMYFG